MKALRSIAGASFVLALSLPAISSAASLVYTLDSADTLPDGTGYVQVTLSDGTAGAIDFEVRLLPALDSFLSEGAGIRTFSLNVRPDADAYWKDVTGLPDDWKAKHGAKTSFGIFDLRIASKSDAVTDVLRFSIDGVEDDTLTDYVSLSFGPAKAGHSYFAAKVTGIELEASNARTATFAATVVPLPPSIWLLGSALSMVGLFGRRRHS